MCASNASPGALLQAETSYLAPHGFENPAEGRAEAGPVLQSAGDEWFILHREPPRPGPVSGFMEGSASLRFHAPESSGFIEGSASLRFHASESSGFIEGSASLPGVSGSILRSRPVSLKARLRRCLTPVPFSGVVRFH